MRRIQAPGIELNEIDRSQYAARTAALDGAPYCFICGFSDKGENYAVKSVSSKQELLREFGQPQTEYERYFYNGCLEVIGSGGICLASRLPYDNASLDRYTFCDYTISLRPTEIPDIDTVTTDYIMFAVVAEQLSSLILDEQYPWSDYAYDIFEKHSLSSAQDAISCLADMEEIYNDVSAGDIVSDELDSSMSADSIVPFDELSDIIHVKAALKAAVNAAVRENADSFAALKMADSDLTSCISISSDASRSGKITLKELDDLRVGNTAAILNKMRIVDISRSNYDSSSQPTVKSSMKDECGEVVIDTNDCLGIVPVVTSPANALYFQELLQTQSLDTSKLSSLGEYCTVGSMADGKTYSEASLLSVVHSEFMDTPATLTVDLSQLQDDANLVMPLSSSSSQQPSLSRVAASQFPPIVYQNAEHFDPTYLKCIGIAVFKAYRDDANSGQVGFQLLESFVGSLDKTAADQLTGASMYIDKVVNQSSKYINVFTNIPSRTVQQASIVTAPSCQAYSLGFYQLDLVKSITFQTSVSKALSRLLDKISNPNLFPLDLVIDAGVSNIAQVAGSHLAVQRLESRNDAAYWQIVLQKFDDFCKYTRKDCMFLADGLKSFCLVNDAKVVRDTDPSSSVQTSILPKLKYMSAINSSYSAGYCNWFLARDEYSGDLYWCPPSIKAVRSYIYCDTYCHPWSVPAGMSRGKVVDAYDVAFQPTVDEAGKIYSQTWNYAVSYPADGIVIEGQKTFQKAYTALDRVNVRRLMLYLEKTVVRIARRFLYEGNTEYLRQQFVDAISPVFDDAKTNSGIVDYAIKCDAELNTPQVIDNNEMRCKIAVKPVKALEYLVLDFIVTNQSADVREEVSR